MNDLPDPASGGNTNTQTLPPNTDDVISATPTGNKEVVGGTITQEESLHDGTGSEFELPKEVSSAGVRIQPTSVPIPQSVASLGVKPAGQSVPVQTVPLVSLPLSDDQIAAGLHASITDSIRWLAEWCVHRLKHLHIAIKNVHGSLVRVKERQ